MSTKASISLVSDQGGVSPAVALSARSNFVGPVDLTAVDTGSTPTAVLAANGANVLEVPSGATYLAATPRLSANAWTAPSVQLWGVDGNGFMYPLQNMPGNFTVSLDGTVTDCGVGVTNGRYTAQESAAGQLLWDLRGAAKVLVYRTVAATVNGALYGKFL